jgi:hypothetical protein
MDRSVVAALAEVLPNPTGAAEVRMAVPSLPEVLVTAFGAKAVVGMGPGMAVPTLEVGVPSHED